MCEDEVLLEEEECEVVLLVDGDPLPLVPVQVIVLNQHLKWKRRETSVMLTSALYKLHVLDFKIHHLLVWSCRWSEPDGYRSELSQAKPIFS